MVVGDGWGKGEEPINQLQRQIISEATQSTSLCLRLTTMTIKSVGTLRRKMQFLNVLLTFPPFSPFPPPLPTPEQCFWEGGGHSTYTTLNWGAGGIRELMLDANELE